MKERVVLLRQSPALVGVLTEAIPSPEKDGLTGIVILNAGIIHRVGPHRLHVRLSRALAAAGFPVLRFDLSGLGDSDVGGDTVSFTESGPAETREAMNFMAQVTGVKRFVLAGICSGAGMAFQVACMDPRVVGVVPIEPYAFPTLKFRLRYYLHRLGRMTSWYNTLTGRNAIVRRLIHRLRGNQPVVPRAQRALVSQEAIDNSVSRAEVATMFRGLIDRGVRFCFVFSGMPSNYNYQGQLQDAFPDVPMKDSVQVAFFKDADHTFSQQHTQNRLIETLSRWASAAFQLTMTDAIARSLPPILLSAF